MSGDAAAVWPLWGVRLRAPRLVLRPMREADVLATSALASDGIHDPAEMPFLTPWTDLPSPERERSSLQFWAGTIASWTPASWRLLFVVESNGMPIGVQDIAAEDFAVARTVETGSWLGRAHQGQGFGKEMRTAVLAFAFGSLGARRAGTVAFEDNAASLGVTRSLGYRPNGDGLTRRRDACAREERWVMDRADWEASPARGVQVSVDGVDAAVLALCGATT